MLATLQFASSMKLDYLHTHTASLPSISLHKQKKYERPQFNQQHPLKHDIDSIILHLAPTPQPSTYSLLKQRSSNLLKQRPSNISTACTPCLHWQEMKKLRAEIGKYIQMMGKPHCSKEADYTEFVRLSGESQDYLEYYIRNHFQHAEEGQNIECADKAVIVSLLKNNYQCLTQNPQQIVNRILLSYGINPLNDFHLVPWTPFANFRKIAALKQNKSQTRKFLLNYFLSGNHSLKKEQFWSIVGGIVRKLKAVISERNVERLFEKVVEAGSWVPDEMARDALQTLMGTYWYFLWEQLVQLIFTV